MPNNLKLTLNISQIFLHLIVIYGYLVAVIPFGYFSKSIAFGLNGFIVVPTCLIISSVLAFQSENRTTRFVVFNLLMSMLAIIPLFGYLAILVGLVTALTVSIAIFTTLFNPKTVDLNEKIIDFGQSVGVNLNTNGVVNKYAPKTRGESVDVEINSHK